MAEVAVTAVLPGDALERLSSRHTVRVHRGGPLAGEELAEFVGDAAALICIPPDRVDAAAIAGRRRLRIIAACAVGYNNIDLQAARSAGVWVTHTPDVLTEATADLTWALILAVTRRVVEGDGVMRRGEYPGWKPDYFLGTGLQGKTLGIVGFGRIGRAVARRAAAFGMAVRYNDTRRADPDAEAGAVYEPELDVMLPRTDVLSLHCPLTSATRGLVDGRRLRLLPPGAVLVNTSRGEVVVEADLAAVLEEGRLWGAGLDVFEHEPDAHPALVGRSDVVLLPHLGSATRETRAAMAGLAADNVLAVLSGEQPPTPVLAPRSR